MRVRTAKWVGLVAMGGCLFQLGACAGVLGQQFVFDILSTVVVTIISAIVTQASATSA